MPTYWSAHRQTFVGHVRRVNPHFERVLQSSLRPLIDMLKREPTPRTHNWVLEVKKWLLFAKRQSDRTYRNKVNKYKDALYHLVQNLNIANEFTVGGINATKACRFKQTKIPHHFDPGDFPPEKWNVTRMVVPCEWHERTIEDSIARGEVDGIIVIHMNNFIANAMNEVFDGWKTIDHMNSVLRVARNKNPHVPLALVEINNQDVCNEFSEASNYPGRTRCSVNLPNPDGVHSAQLSPLFRNWIAGKQNVVVMGYDAAVCVRANLFGVQETIASALGAGPIFMRGNPSVPKRWVKPLVSLTSVETSRALLATAGNLSPMGHIGEYGHLHGL